MVLQPNFPITPSTCQWSGLLYIRFNSNVVCIFMWQIHILLVSWNNNIWVHVPHIVFILCVNGEDNYQLITFCCSNMKLASFWFLLYVFPTYALPSAVAVFSQKLTHYDVHHLKHCMGSWCMEPLIVWRINSYGSGAACFFVLFKHALN